MNKHVRVILETRVGVVLILNGWSHVYMIQIFQMLAICCKMSVVYLSTKCTLNLGNTNLGE